MVNSDSLGVYRESLNGQTIVLFKLSKYHAKHTYI